MKIAIASDHAGFPMKEHIKEYLSSKYVVIDFGTYSTDSVDYPDFGAKAAEAVASGECERGILVCGSGIGMSIIANKVDGVRAALCYQKDLAIMSRRHNNSNVLVLAGRYTAKEYAEEIIDSWIAEEFEGDRHNRRIEKIKKYEERGIK